MALINGDAGNNTLPGTAADDTINGRRGNDTLVASTGNDILNGGQGIDTASYDSFGRAIELNLLTLSTGKGAGELDLLLGIENAIGTQFGDTMIGDGRANRLDGRWGDDLIRGEGGNDRLLGNDGEDDVAGGAGSDFVAGGEGGDDLSGGNGHDTVYGGGGDDLIEAGSGNDSVRGDAGEDFIFAGEGNDLVDGGDDSDEIFGGAGNDLLSGGDNSDLIVGGDGNDDLFGNEDSDFLDGGEGDDLLDGGEDDDVLLGDEGQDLLNGGEDDDYVSGADGDDLLLGDFGAGPLGADVFAYGTELFWFVDPFSSGPLPDAFLIDDLDLIIDNIIEQNHGIDVILDFQDGTDRINLFGFQEIFELLDIGFDTEDPIGGGLGVGPNGVLDNQDLFVDVEAVTFNGVTLASTIIDVSGLIGAAVELVDQLDLDPLLEQFLGFLADQDTSTQQLIVFGAAGGTLSADDFTGFDI